MHVPNTFDFDKTILVFFNGDDLVCPEPQADTWNNYQNVESAKLFLACCESWRRNGWTPIRIDTNNRNADDWEPSQPRMVEACKLYPARYWRIWWSLAQFMSDTRSPYLWTCTMDVFNYGFDPLIANAFANYGTEHYAASFQYQHFSCALLRVTRDFLTDMISLIKYADNPIAKLDDLPAFVSDESLYRMHGRMWKHVPLMRYAYVEENWQTACLLHYPKSCVRRALGL